MKPSGICHPTARPTPALHCSSPPHPPPPSSSLPPSCRDICSQTHTHSITNKHTHAYTGTEKNYLSYTKSKQRISKAHVLRSCLCICSLFGVLFGRISALSLNKEKGKQSQKNRTPSCFCFFFQPSPPAKPQDGETQGCEHLRITAQSRARSLGNHTGPHME